MKLRKEVFGTTKKGEMIDRYVMTADSGVQASFLTLGAIWETMKVPGRDGKTDDVILGFDDLPSYEENIPHFGSPVGRCANRIAGAAFELNGRRYELAANSAGVNNLHSGPELYHTRVWQGAAEEGTDQASVTFRLESPDGDQGFSGNLSIAITYTLKEDGSLEIHYQAVPDQDTIVNFTNHCYFNLAGQQYPQKAMQQLVRIESDAFTPADATGVPTGEIRPVEGTPMDFRTFKPIERDISEEYEPLHQGNGYDHNWLLRNKRGEMGLAAVCKDVQSGRVMEVYTDLPAMQFYTFNMTPERERILPAGKGGTHYTFRSACCFETHYVPDAIHQPQFDSPIVRAGESYDSTTIYRFMTEA